MQPAPTESVHAFCRYLPVASSVGAGPAACAAGYTHSVGAGPALSVSLIRPHGRCSLVPRPQVSRPPVNQLDAEVIVGVGRLQGSEHSEVLQHFASSRCPKPTGPSRLRHELIYGGILSVRPPSFAPLTRISDWYQLVTQVLSRLSALIHSSVLSTYLSDDGRTLGERTLENLQPLDDPD